MIHGRERASKTNIEHCANCSLFLVVEELEKEIKRLREEVEDLKKQLNKPQKRYVK